MGVLACAIAGCSGDRASEVVTEQATVARLLVAPPSTVSGDPQAWAAVKDAYRLTDGRLLWTHDGKPSRAVAGLKFAVDNVVSDGLDAARYDLAAIDALLDPPGDAEPAPDALAAADVRWTLAAVQLVRDLDRGVTAEALDEHWLRDPAPAPYAAIVGEAAKSANVERVLRQVVPRDPQYARLRALLVQYRKIAADGGFPALPKAIDVKPGGSAPEVVALRARLVAGGHLQRMHDDPVFDVVMAETLKRIQDAHALKPTGLPDAPTLAALAVPVEERIRQIELNLERWRWLPADLGSTRIVVNVPTYHLTAFENDRPALAMRIVAGKPESATPIFSDIMESVVFSPFWNVPTSIQRNELAPKLAQDPGYLAQQNMEVVVDGETVDPYSVDLNDPNVRVRQRPGASNALGHVKFLFPNPFNVYLHDTPSDNLFARSERGFSHGCVRLERPADLAQWVLGPQPEWTPQKIEDAMHSGVEKHVALERDVPVHVLYQTVWIDDDGTMRFADDVYGHDKRQAPILVAALAAPPRSEVQVAQRGD